jgi:uncharacterized protein YjeT (DUF2065 family)
VPRCDAECKTNALRKNLVFPVKGLFPFSFVFPTSWKTFVFSVQKANA